MDWERRHAALAVEVVYGGSGGDGAAQLRGVIYTNQKGNWHRMDDQKQQVDRWRELAELLGLPADTPAPVHEEKPKAEAPRSETPAIKAYEEPPRLVAHHP